MGVANQSEFREIAFVQLSLGLVNICMPFQDMKLQTFAGDYTLIVAGRAPPVIEKAK